MVCRQVIFCQLFTILDDFSKCCETLENHQICQNFGKKWRKAFVDLPSTHFSADYRYPKVGFRVPIPPLAITYTHYFYSTVSIPLIFWKNKKPNNCFPIINIVMLAIRQWTDLIWKKIALENKKKIRIKIFNF